MPKLSDLKVKLFADGADKKGMLELAANPLIKGMTTNPTLMRKSGVTEYESFAKEILQHIKDKPISFEVFTDDHDDMRRQALKIRTWQDNVYVKIPITNTKGVSSLPLIKELAKEGLKINVTAILTEKQVADVAQILNKDVPSVVSVFAGRVADTGVDPMPAMKKCRDILKDMPKAELLWASVREVLNIFQADECGCAIVTVPHEILNKAMKTVGHDLTEVSLDTVKTFYTDATAAGFKL
jgi:transaldolase